MNEEAALKTTFGKAIRGPQPIKSGARSGGQNAVLISHDSSLALMLGRLAEAQHIPLTLFWSLQAAAEAPLLTADVVMIDAPLWHDLQQARLRRLEALVAGVPVILIVSQSEQNRLPMQMAENIQVVALPTHGAAAAIMQVALRSLKEAAVRVSSEDMLVLPLAQDAAASLS